MKLELLDRATILFLEECYVGNHHWDKAGKCDGKPQICLFKWPRNEHLDVLIQGICNKHKKYYSEYEGHALKTIIRLTKKDVFYLRVTGKL